MTPTDAVSATCVLAETPRNHSLGTTYVYAWVCACGARSPFVFATPAGAAYFHSAHASAEITP